MEISFTITLSLPEIMLLEQSLDARQVGLADLLISAEDTGGDAEYWQAKLDRLAAMRQRLVTCPPTPVPVPARLAVAS